MPRLPQLLFLAALSLPSTYARAAPHQASQKEIECQESFEKVLSFRRGWRMRVKQEKNPAVCSDIMRSSTKLIPPIAPSCRKVKFVNVSKEMQQEIIGILKTKKNPKIPKRLMHQVYKQVIRRTIWNLRYFCGQLAKPGAGADAEKWEPGMAAPEPRSQATPKK